MSELVSILMPAYQAQATVGYAVRSVLKQEHENWELLIISDDGQDYRPVLEKEGIRDKRIRFLSSGGARTGPSNTRNVGLDAASGDFIALLDADDIWLPQKLSCALPQAKIYGFVITAVDEVQHRPDGFYAFRSNAGKTGSRPLIANECCWVNFTSNALCVYDRRRVPTRWHAELPVFEDMLFSLEAYNHIDSIFFIDEPLHLYVARENSLSRGSEATQQFISTKFFLAEWLKSDSSWKKQAREAALNFLELSIASEERYREALKRQPHLTFIELLQAVCAEHGITVPLTDIDPPRKVWTDIP